MSLQIVDVIPFFNEIDLLEIRLNILHEKVDKFIISEFSTSFAGHDKGFIFPKYRSKFAKFENKIIYSPKSHTPDSDPFKNDRFQKDAIEKDILEHVKESGVILFGDLDEIPNPEQIESAIHALRHGCRIAHFAQEPFYGFLNMKDVSGRLLSFAGEYDHIVRKKWIGTVATTLDYAISQGMTNLRNPEQKKVGKRIRNGGWHFSYCGGAEQEFEERLSIKLAHNAHQEFNNDQTINALSTRLQSKEDFLGRTTTNILGRKRIAKLKPMVMNKKFPNYLLTNQEKYRHLIYDCD